MNRPLALVLALLLAAPIALLPPPAAADHESPPGGWPPNATGRLHFMRLDERTLPTSPFDDVFGTGSLVMLNVTDTGLTEETVNVTVTSTSDITGEEVVLQRVRAGVYHGFIGFETTLVARNGEVFVRDRDRVQAVYRDHLDASNSAAVSQDSLTWYEMGDGRVLLDETTYVGTGARARVTVLDRVVPASTPTFDVHVNSTSSPDPVTITLARLADGQYQGSFGFSWLPLVPCTADCPVVPADHVLVRDDDQVTVTFAEKGIDARGHEEDPQVSARWEQRHTALLQFLDADRQTILSSSNAGGTATFYGTPSNGGAIVRLEDPDLRGQRNVTVNLFSTSSTSFEVDPTGINVVLAEVGTGTGEFIGTAGFVRESASTATRLRVTDDAHVGVRYTDAQDVLGARRELSAAGVWESAVTTSILFRNNAFTHPGTINPRWVNATHADACTAPGGGAVACHPDRANIEVWEPDLTASSITVRVTSTRDPLGVPVVLAATSPSGGTYRGWVGFNFTHSHPAQALPNGTTGPVIWLACGDQLRVTTQDDRNADGRPATVVQTATAASGGETGCNTAGPALPASGTVTLSILRNGAAVSRITERATYQAEVRDGTQNRNTTVTETLRRTLVAATDGNPAVWSLVAGSEIRNAGSTHNVTGRETGVNTGIFRGTFEVDTDLEEFVVDVPTAIEDTLCLYWLHKNAAGRNVTLLRSCVEVDFSAETFALPRLAFRDRVHQGVNVTRYDGFETAVVWLQDRDRIADPTNGTDTATVRITSTSDTTGITVQLTERYGHHGMVACGVHEGGCPASGKRDDRAFFGTFRFTTGSSSDSRDELKVSDDDVVSAFYADPFGNGTFSTAVRWNRATTATLSIDQPVFRMDQDGELRARVTVVDADQDTTAAPEVVVLGLRNEETGEASTLTLTETAGGSGIFSGLMAFNPADKPNLCGGVLCTTDQVIVRDGDHFTVRYEDMDDAAGQRGNVTVRAQWFDINGARLLLDSSRYNTLGARANVTLQDPDRDVTSLVDEVFVQVTSDSDGNGVRLRLVETGPRTGVFAGGFGFEAAHAAGNDRVVVADGDRVMVNYADREVDGDGIEAPAEFRHKHADATWRAIANRGPQITVATQPAAGTGGRVQVGEDGRVNFTVTVTDPDGTVARWEIDYGDNQRESGVGAVSGRVFRHTYTRGATMVFRATDNEGTQNQTTVPIVLAGLDDDPPAAIADLRADARVTSVVLRWTAPENNALERDGAAPFSYDVRHSPSPILTEAAFRAATPPVATQLLFSPVPLAAAGRQQVVTVTGLEAGTEYVFAVAAKDAAGNAGGFDTVNVTTLESDETPPAAPTGLASSHARNQPSAVQRVEFEWDEVTDDSPVLYVVLLDSDPATQLTRLGTAIALNDTTFVANYVSDGTYHFHVAACSDGGCSTTTHYGPIVIRTSPALTPAQIEAANKAVEMQVLREGSDNVVRWALPDSAPAPVAGVQIWRSTSPFELIATFDRGTPEYQAGEYVDRNASRDARYLVTVYFGRTSTDGFSGGPSSEVPGFASLGEGEGVAVGGTKLPTLFWVLMAVGVVAILLLVFGLIVVWRRHPEDEEAWVEQPGQADEGLAWSVPEEPAPAPEQAWGGLDEDDAYTVAGMEPVPMEEEPPMAPPVPAPPAPAEPAPDPNTHHLTCPSCGADFMAVGPKPLVTECPSCGVRGILR